MIHEFWAGRIGPYLPESSAVVVQAAEDAPAPPPLVETDYAPTVPELAAAELVVLGELAAATERLGSWEACRELFGAAAVSGPGGDGPGGPPASRVSASGAETAPA